MIDFHCHLDLYPDPHKITRECQSRNLYILSVTNTPSAWAGTVALASDSERIWTALGLHPQIAHERKSELSLFDQLLPKTRYVGEIGLDGAPEFKLHWADQITVFKRVLDSCSRVGGRILSIHSRRAVTPVLDVLEAHSGAGIPILHWFSGSTRELDHAVALGCWFSINQTMLGGKKGRELVAKMPRDHVLTESDGPFTLVNGRAALPWDTELTAIALAELWTEPIDNVHNRLVSNMLSLGEWKDCL